MRRRPQRTEPQVEDEGDHEAPECEYPHRPGQAFLLSSLLLVAILLGLVPDRLAAVRAGRTALAETIAINA